jgi:hypothetical protein
MAKRTVLDMVVTSIRNLKDHDGSSRQAIHKFLKSEFDSENTSALKQALIKGVKQGNSDSSYLRT